MTAYHNFIGIDIGKFSFVVASHEEKITNEYENSLAGIMQFIVQIPVKSKTSFVLLAM